MSEDTENLSASSEFSFDASDPTQVSARVRKSKRKESRDDLFTKQIMSTPEGRAWMFGILEMAHLFHESQTEREEGERRLGLKILSRINRACPELYIQMLSDRLKDAQ